MIEFNKIFYTGNEIKYIENAMQNKTLHGDGKYSEKVCELLESKYNVNKVMLLPSCTSALEMSAIMLDLNSEDEVIMPSYTFVSTANAFALRGCKIKFVDINPSTMNISIDEIKKAITNKTKAVITVNYGGVSIDYDKLKPFLKERGIYLIEDNAQGIGAKYKNEFLGTIGDFGCISFHDTKNITSGGEGGAIFINNKKNIKKAEIISEKGTDRKAFINKKVDKYSWKMIGSSYLMNEIDAAFLLAQIESIDEINDYRNQIWDKYYSGLEILENRNYLIRQVKPEYASSNAHLFFIRLKTNEDLEGLKKFLNNYDIESAIHYVPLHTSEAGIVNGEFIGDDIYTTKESELLLRLPMNNNLTIDEVVYIIEKIKIYFGVGINE